MHQAHPERAAEVLVCCWCFGSIPPGYKGRLDTTMAYCMDTCASIIDNCMCRLAALEDCSVIGVDETYKFLMSLNDEPPFGHPQDGLGHPEVWHVAPTAWSMSGCVFSAIPYDLEQAQHVMVALAKMRGPHGCSAV